MQTVSVEKEQTMQALYVKALKWPVITWVVVDVILLVAGLVYPDVLPKATSEAFSPLLVAFGIWAGYKMAEFGGNYGHVIGAGLVVGLVCAILTIIGFGLILGAGAGAVLPDAVFSLLMNLAGALVGGGFALSKVGQE